MPATANSRAIATPATGAAPERPPLDEVMLAMDIVDTLRHDESLAADALGDAAREQALVDQVRRTYADQGIAVSDAVIAEAVASLRERRFQYRAPAPSLQVRLAKLYVSRGRWAPKLAVAVVMVGGLLFGAYFLGARIDDWRFARVQSELAERTAEWVILDNQFEAVIESAGQQGGSPPPQALATRLQDAAATAQDLRRDASAQLAPLSVQPAALRTLWEDDPDRVAAILERAEAHFDGAKAALIPLANEVNAARQLLVMRAGIAGLVDRIRTAAASAAGVTERAARLAAEFESALAAGDVDSARDQFGALGALADRVDQRAAMRIDSIPAAHRATAAGHLAAMDAALLAGDAAAFDRAEAALDELTRALATAYSLRIVNRQGEQSGVWRHPNDNRSARNYYVVVDAIGPDGGRVRIPVRNEETGRTDQVSTFAVRVPEHVYEQVKADKLDNGLIDRDVFGEKRVGELEAVYAFETAGGAITDW